MTSFHDRRPPRALCAAAISLAIFATSCRTRLLTAEEEWNPGTSDAAAARDRDLAPPPPDIARLVDLTVPPDNCGVYVIQTTQVVRAQLLIVQDRSTSMSRGLDGQANPPAGQSKWDQVRAAIKQVVAGTSSVDWGLWLYGNGTQCGVNANPDVPVAPGNAAAIARTLDATQLAVSTPTTRAVDNALAWLLRQNNDQPRYLLVATDGQPTCVNGSGNGNDSTNAITAVTNAAQRGVRTFIVGIGSDTGAEQTLEAMAQAGGVPNMTQNQPGYYPVASSKDLVKILEDAALRITPCEYPLPALPPAPNRVLITSGSGEIPQDRTRRDGWDYSDDGKQVIFYGAACLLLKEGKVPTVRAVYGCPLG